MKALKDRETITKNMKLIGKKIKQNGTCKSNPISNKVHSSKWSRDLNSRGTTIIPCDLITELIPCDPGLGKGFLRMTPKCKSQRKIGQIGLQKI